MMFSQFQVDLIDPNCRYQRRASAKGIAKESPRAKDSKKDEVADKIWHHIQASIKLGKSAQKKSHVCQTERTNKPQAVEEQQLIESIKDITNKLNCRTTRSSCTETRNHIFAHTTVTPNSTSTKNLQRFINNGIVKSSGKGTQSQPNMLLMKRNMSVARIASKSQSKPKPTLDQKKIAPISQRPSNKRNSIPVVDRLLNFDKQYFFRVSLIIGGQGSWQKYENLDIAAILINL